MHRSTNFKNLNWYPPNPYKLLLRAKPCHLLLLLVLGSKGFGRQEPRTSCASAALLHPFRDFLRSGPFTAGLTAAPASAVPASAARLAAAASAAFAYSNQLR